MRIIRSLIAPAAALAVASGIAVLPALASAPPASALPSCTGTSLIWDRAGFFQVRVPTIGNGTGNDDCELGPGNDSVAVQRLQIALDQCDLPFIPYPAIAADGSYGVNTENAVKATQRYWGITADGIYGPQTRGAMGWPVAGSNGGICTSVP